jgi:hypothetical protein
MMHKLSGKANTSIFFFFMKNRKYVLWTTVRDWRSHVGHVHPGRVWDLQVFTVWGEGDCVPVFDAPGAGESPDDAERPPPVELGQ